MTINYVTGTVTTVEMPSMHLWGASLVSKWSNWLKGSWQAGMIFVILNPISLVGVILYNMHQPEANGEQNWPDRHTSCCFNSIEWFSNSLTLNQDFVSPLKWKYCTCARLLRKRTSGWWEEQKGERELQNIPCHSFVHPLPQSSL